MYQSDAPALARANAQGQQSGNSNIANGAPRDSSGTEIISRELDESIQRLKDLCGRQQEMRDRLFGSSPTTAGGVEKSPQMPGSLGAINDQLMFLRQLTSQVLQNQIMLEKLG